MLRASIKILSVLSGLFLTGCGLGVSQLTEVWDRDPNATLLMEKQIKRAIFCELRTSAKETAKVDTSVNYYGGNNVTTPADEFGDTWGAQVTITLTADEKSSLTPSVSLKILWSQPRRSARVSRRVSRLASVQRSPRRTYVMTNMTFITQYMI